MDRCHLCARPLTDAVHVHDRGRTGPLTTVACFTCGLVQTVPHASPEAVAAYYSSGDYRREFPPLPDDPQTRALQPADVSGSGRVLEVGCGNGAWASRVTMRGIQIDATEPDETVAVTARARGVNVVKEPARPYQAAFAFQVIEHFADPVQGIAENLVRHVVPGGLVYVEVPCVEEPYQSLSHFFQRPHVVTYDSRTLAAALMLAGLERVATQIHGHVLCGFGVRRDPPTLAEWTMGGPARGEGVAAYLHAWAVVNGGLP